MNQRSTLLIRYSLTALFLWFGFQQLTDPSSWITFLPSWTGYFPIPGEMLIQLNGWFEIVAATMLGLGIWTRLVAGVLGLHLIGIAASVGGAVGMRDLALGLCTVAITLSHPDAQTLDQRLKDKQPVTPTTS